MDLPSPAWVSSWPEARPVSVWRLRLNALADDPTDVLRPLTVASEHARARRYQFAADRHRHLAGRALVRLALSRRYDCTPDTLSLTKGPHGKPRLQPSSGDRPPVHFNIGHTGPVVVAAVSQNQPVGIDVEPRTRSVDADALAERILTAPERSQWRSRPPSHRQAAFLHMWTCKEALLKATGEGLQRAPESIECTFDGATVAALTDAPAYRPPCSSASAAPWTVQPFMAAETVLGALVRKDAVPTPISWVDATKLIMQSGG